jgi:hypothetical protein
MNEQLDKIFGKTLQSFIKTVKTFQNLWAHLSALDLYKNKASSSFLKVNRQVKHLKGTVGYIKFNSSDLPPIFN